MSFNRTVKRKFRHKRIRKKINGTSLCPRLCISRTLNNISAQVIDDSLGKTIFGMSTQDKELRSRLKSGGNIDAAMQFGRVFAEAAQKKGIKKIRFDRGGYLYHGRVKAFAEAAREGGLEF